MIKIDKEITESKIADLTFDCGDHSWFIQNLLDNYSEWLTRELNKKFDDYKKQEIQKNIDFLQSRQKEIEN